ncbi:MAG: PAS domain-containing sensor histidine kinase [Hyphomicrobiales bacterium]|nr:PAS domain-containing sensor histidine kinase [Hyphomicrobiales bacterium]
MGPYVVAAAVACTLINFFIIGGFAPIAVTDNALWALFITDVALIALLALVVVGEGWNLISAWRKGATASGLHMRVVRVFLMVAAVPALVIAIVGWAALDRALSPGFMQDVRAFIFNTAEAARLFQQSQCRSLLQEAQLTASDLDRAKPMYDADRALFHEFFASRARYLGFSNATLIKETGETIESAQFPAPDQPKLDVGKPEPSDFAEARRGDATCIVTGGGKAYAALRQITAFPGVYLYVARPLDPFTLEFPQQAGNLISLYNNFAQQRRNVLTAFAVMFALLTLVLLLSAVWFGLSFANRLMTPIRRLIAATDAVSAGNLDVRVPIDKREGDLAHLGETFNKMTGELRAQQDSLVQASLVNEERRAFTEAVLSGVPAAVAGVDPHGLVTVANPSARELASGEGAVGRSVADVYPEIALALADAAHTGKAIQSQVSMLRNGRERIVNLRVAPGAVDEAGRSYVVTLDDITELVTAQRTSAWADVARRIAHEIKNPLTPIQLSAERLKRKYGRVITQDRDVFDQCTDTIVRQVDDIKRMVDEFSSFARMPKARPESDDLVACVRQVVFLMRVGHPNVEFVEHYESETLTMRFDRRLISQALTNIIKNATEGVEAAEGRNGAGRVAVSVRRDDGFALIDVIDNGRGFPEENRQRLLEPYVTTRSEGTGLGLPIVAKILEEHGGGLALLDAPNGPGAWVHMRLSADGLPQLTNKTDAKTETH